jgi:GT2 family glycosyltransferase
LPADSPMTLASIVITTRCRRQDTLRAVASCFAQDFPGLEVIVFDDASGDGTAESIQAAFPKARVIALTNRSGLIENRNRGFREARGKYVFSLDDDSYFSRSDIVSSIAALLERDPTIGAVAIPFVEPRKRRSLSSLARPLKARPGDELSSYVACACAIRRDAALAIGGYRTFYVRQHEEPDFCLRLRAAGSRIVYGDSGYIVHTVNPRRDPKRISFYGVRNLILFEMLNSPLCFLPFRLVSSIVGILSYRFSWSTLRLKLHAVGAGILESVRRRSERRPVAIQVYREYRRLPGHGPEDWQGDVPVSCHETRVAA